MSQFYYDKTEMLSYKALLNFLLGGRGTGKTFGMKEWSIKDGIKTGHKFLWVRRYKEEIKAMRSKFFNDIQKKFSKVKFSVKGNDNRGDFLADNKIIGSYIALSTSTINKSTPWDEYDKIIFDEFLIMGNTYRYLFNEVVLLLEITNFNPRSLRRERRN